MGGSISVALATGVLISALFLFDSAASSDDAVTVAWTTARLPVL